MFRLCLSLIVCVLALVAIPSKSFGQCQNQGSQASAQSNQQVSLLTQQLQQLQNQLVQQQQARSLAQPAPAVVAQAVRPQAAAVAQTGARTLTDILTSRGYTQRVDPSTGKTTWVTKPNNPKRLTATELTSLGLSARSPVSRSVASR